MSNPKTDDYVGAARSLLQMLDAVIDYEDELPQRALGFLAGPAFAEAARASAAMHRLHSKGELNPAEEPEMAHLANVVLLIGDAFETFQGEPTPVDAWHTVLSMHGALGHALKAVEGTLEVAHA